MEREESYKKVMSEREAGEIKSAVRLCRPERQQVAMVVECVDDLVSAEHPVRMVMAVVERLDVSRFNESIKAREGVAGRDATDPRLLVGLWLYGCIRGIGSARELARRCEESAAFRWMCGGVGVNHRLLSDFRVDHGEALDQLFTQVIASLVDKGLVQVSRISQDGVRVRVTAGAGSFRREERLQKLLEETQQHVEELRKQLENPETSGGNVEQTKSGAATCGQGEAATTGAGDRAVTGVAAEAGGNSRKQPARRVRERVDKRFVTSKYV
jgi:transposase